MTVQATFQKLNSGEWGLRVQGTMHGGERVEVNKRDGKKETKNVGNVLWTGNGVSICTIYAGKTAGQQSHSHHYPHVSAGHWLCQTCDEENKNSDTHCWECGCPRK